MCIVQDALPVMKRGWEIRREWTAKWKNTHKWGNKPLPYHISLPEGKSGDIPTDPIPYYM